MFLGYVLKLVDPGRNQEALEAAHACVDQRLDLIDVARHHAAQNPTSTQQ